MATIIGTEGPDTLTETFAVDTIEGLGGDDIIVLDKGQTGLGRDFIDGGDGDDRLIVRRPAAGIEIYSNFDGEVYLGRAESYFEITNVEHVSIYHLTGEGKADNIFTGNGDDVYYFTATNNSNVQAENNQVDLGSGSNDLIVIDASGVFGWGVTVNPIQGFRSMMWVGSAQRINFINIERLHFTGGALGDPVVGLSGNDIIDGRDGNDTLSGLGGDDRLIGGNGNDSLDGGEGNDTLVFTTGNDTIAGGNGSDRLEIDARTVGAAVTFAVAGEGPYAGSVTLGGGAANFSGIESFTIYSNPGSYGDVVTTGAGDDVFYHYGINSTDYAMDQVDLGGGSNDLLVADFSAVTDHAVAKASDPLPNGHYQFTVGGNAKVDFTGVERIHFIGGAQADTVFGLAGDDVLEGRAGADHLFGGDGNDDLAGGIGNSNEIDGGNGDDILRSVSFGFDFVQGGPGFDTAIIDYSDLTTSVTNTSGGTIAYSAVGLSYVALTDVERIVITTGSGNDAIVTHTGDDEIRTGAGNDNLNGGDGDDYLDGGSGADDMAGLAGDDTYIVDHIHDTIIDDSPTGGTDLVYVSLASYTLPTGVENAIAQGGGSHSLRGNAGNNSLTGESGADTLLLQDGGDDRAFGLAGNDIIYFGAAYTNADQADGGAGRDAIVLQGNYNVILGTLTGIESVSLQSGANTTFGDTANNFYDFNITTVNGNVAAGQQLIVNAQSLRAGEDFTFDGSAETDGKFLIYGGHGVDLLTGGAGVDIFFFEGSRWGAGDKVAGGAGRDALVISAGSGLTHIEFAADSLNGIESISVNQTYATDPTQTPSYEFVLNNGNVTPGETLIVNASSLTSIEQTVGIDGSDVHDGNLILFGGAGNDILTGGDGHDVLFGGGYADTLFGGAGADIYRYDRTSDSNASRPDLIAGFQTGLDKIDLSRIDANPGVAGDQAFTWIGSNPFSAGGAVTAGELRTYEDGGYRWIAGDTNGDGVADLLIALTPPGGAPLGIGDFLL